jgi:hypothetical protein
VDYGQGYAIGEPAAQASAISGTVVEQCQRMRRHLLRRGSALGVTSAGIHGMHLVTSALSKATDLADLHAAVARAARDLKVDETVSRCWTALDRCAKSPRAARP